MVELKCYQILDESSMEFTAPSILVNGSPSSSFALDETSRPSQPLVDPNMQPLHFPNLLSRPNPSIVVTLPTPRVSQSPVFQPRSPITLAKYVQATSPDSDLSPACASSSSLSPVPSVPACDRCCLAELEEGVTCRSCERQWLACKMWYQANDGGRRQWLTEPFIRPAESNASLRAVMGVLGVPGSTDSADSAGLGIRPSGARKEPPFKVVPNRSPAQGPGRHCGCNSCAGEGRTSAGAARWRRIRVASVKMGKAAIRTVVVLSMQLLASLSPTTLLLDASYGTGTTTLAAQVPPSSSGHPSSSGPLSSLRSSRSVLACVTSGSRFVEHAV